MGQRRQRPPCAAVLFERRRRHELVTAMFVPVAEGLADRLGADRRRYLMPLAFASMTGGVCTLIGTSTNIAVARAMVHHGLEPLGMFELAPVGLGAALVGLGYLVLVAPRLLGQLPPRPHGTEGTREFLYEVFVRPGGGLAGKGRRIK